MQKSVFLFLGSIFIFSGVFFFIFTYNNFDLTIFDCTRVNKHRVILIVLDALRHDYLEVTKARKIDLPNLNRMASVGARSIQVVPVYPSVTMTNHQTLLTGLYSPYHGIVGNSFNDSSMRYDQFAMGSQVTLNDARWYKDYPDPIWVTCQKNTHCKTGSMLWPNTDAVIGGQRPSRYVGQYTPLNQEPNVIYPYERRVDELIGWISEDLIDLGLLYFDEPDATSHKYGPLHNKTLSKLKEMDRYIGRLLEGLQRINLLDTTDIILTGDHGMTELSEERVVEIDKFVNPDIYKSTYSYPVGIIYPNEGKFDEVFEKYSKASSHIKVYKREDVPKHLHFSENVRRISPIVTVVELGWFVNSSHWKQTVGKGSHGYDPGNADMHTTLLAMGPSFAHVTINGTHHVDVYPLMMHLLGLKANPHNGSFTRIAPILTDKARHWTSIEVKWVYNRTVLVMYFVVVVQVVAVVAFLGVMVCKDCRRRTSARMVARYNPEQAEALITSRE